MIIRFNLSIYERLFGIHLVWIMNLPRHLTWHSDNWHSKCLIFLSMINLHKKPNIIPWIGSFNLGVEFWVNRWLKNILRKYLVLILVSSVTTMSTIQDSISLFAPIIWLPRIIETMYQTTSTYFLETRPLHQDHKILQLSLQWRMFHKWFSIFYRNYFYQQYLSHFFILSEQFCKNKKNIARINTESILGRRKIRQLTNATNLFCFNSYIFGK